MSFLPVDKQLELISRGTEEVIPLNDLRKKLEKSIADNNVISATVNLLPATNSSSLNSLSSLL